MALLVALGSGPAGQGPSARRKYTADLRTETLDFRGFDSSRILILSGGIPRPMEFPGKFESSDLSRDDLSRVIGRKTGAWERETWESRGPKAGVMDITLLTLSLFIIALPLLLLLLLLLLVVVVIVVFLFLPEAGVMDMVSTAGVEVIKGGMSAITQPSLDLVKNIVFERFLWGELCFLVVFTELKDAGGASKVMRQFPCSRS